MKIDTYCEEPGFLVLVISHYC